MTDKELLDWMDSVAGKEYRIVSGFGAVLFDNKKPPRHPRARRTIRAAIRAAIKIKKL